MYRTIRTTAYEPDPEHGPWTETGHVLDLGEGLHDALSDLHTRLHGDDGRPARWPVRQLNALLRATAPGVIATARGDATDFRAWRLYAREPVPQEVVTPVIGTWTAGLLSDHDGGEGEGDRMELEDKQLQDFDRALADMPGWRTEMVDLTETRTSPGGTAEPAHRLYHLLPEWIAFRLAARPYRSQGAELRFRVVNCEHGAELISWPPQRFEHRNQTWYYSALVRVAAHTVPFADRFRVHVTTSIRRWATQLDVRRWDLNGASVLLNAPLPWPVGPDRGYRLTGNTLGFDRKQGRVVWRRHSPALLLPDLDIVSSYPEPDALLAAPEKWINGQQHISAGIVYSPSLGPHTVGPGLMPKERAALDVWVEDGLRPVLRRVPDLTRVTRHNTPSLLPRSAPADGGVAREACQVLARREALVGALDSSPLEVDIFWQSPETRAELLAALPDAIGLPPGRKVGSRTEDVWRWQADGLDIRVRVRPAGALASRLEISDDRCRPRAARLAEAVVDRCALVADHLVPPRDAKGFAIIEIGDKARFKATPDADPKHALRIACARQGRLSQFINLPADAESTLRHRARWVWLDAFRQLGAVCPPAHRVGAGIPGDLQYAALWLVRYTRKGPTRCPARRLIAVRVRPDDGPGAIRGWDPERADWVPYPQLLLSLAEDADATQGPAPGNGSCFARRTEQQWQREIERQIKTLLYQLRDRPTLLLANSENLRQAWPWLRNSSLVKDMLGFSAAPDQRLAVHGPDLRVVLTRDGNTRAEVPEWYAHDGKGKAGFAKGVWGPPDLDNRVFASTADVPHTARLPKGLMKLVPTAAGPKAPGKSAWNPVLLELTVLGCLSKKALADTGREDGQPDRPAEWATLAHQLRFHDDYPPLARPLPLHLARLAGQYVLPLATARPPQEAGPTAPPQPA
ncbi:pPIWI_RE module domain-containing protein [Streptomyces sp. NPDC050161]|uniref:pPIWI_RE module domain-containing protein n=1 Tax=Streptomyces sp. NPDC050161 TaxID=3365604 RepID=UPI0037A11604